MRWCRVVVCCAILVSPAVLHAQQADDASRAAARSLGTSGVEAFQHGEYKSASEKLEKAYHVLRVPSIGLWSARALVKLGQLVRGSERYREVTQLESTEGQVTIQKQAQADAANELNALTPRLPSIVLQVEGGTAGVTLTVDGTSVSTELVGEHRPADPGMHVVEARRGEQRATAEVTLAEGESKTVALRFEPAPIAVATPPVENTENASHSGLGTQRVVALVAGGVGVVGVAVGTVFGLQAKSKKNQADDHCGASSCADSTGASLNQDALKAGNISTVAFVVGAVGLAGGAVLWFSAPAQEHTAQVGLGFGTVQLRGQW